jgi:apolipoprotein N-acyltransferase
MKDIEILKIELEKAKEDLEQKKFFVIWLEGAIKVEEIKQLTNSATKSAPTEQKGKDE